MKEWLKISILLCVFGFFREIRPSEPFITEYLTGTWRNFTEEQINRDVFPLGTYAYGAQLVLVFLITDFLRYKPLIIVVGLSGIIIWSLLLWTTSLEALQVLELFYGTYMAAEIAYYTYIYAKVDKKYFARVSSHTRAAMFFGKLLGSILSQILVTFKWMDYKELNYISLSTQIFATCWSFFLPKVNKSIYFNIEIDTTDLVVDDCFNTKNKKQENVKNNLTHRIMSAFKLLWTHFLKSYSNFKVVQWSIWYAIALCGQLQVLNYIQLLWKAVDNDQEAKWNAAVDAILTFFGTIFALLAGYLNNLKFGPRGNLLILAILSIVQGLSLLLSSWTKIIYLSYLGYIIFGSLFAFSITVASAEVARHLEDECFGLVFGVNTLVSIILESILTVVVVSKNIFDFDIIQQFTIYSFYFILVGIIYFINVIIECFWCNFKKSKSASDYISP